MHILLAGATGMVGGKVLDRLIHGPLTHRHSVIAMTRRPAPLSADNALNLVVDYDRLEADIAEAAGADVEAVICCLGTTLKAAGSEQAFAKVDRDYVAALARAGWRSGARQFILVSSVGAGAPGSNFYLKTKAEAEAAVRSQGFMRTDILRPGLLASPRAEFRPLEALMKLASPVLTPFLMGQWRNYGGISADLVADAIVALLERSELGAYVHHNPDIRLLAQG
jgi:uncharacterized protein YbjT (DUF2867 family)